MHDIDKRITVLLFLLAGCGANQNGLTTAEAALPPSAWLETNEAVLRVSRGDVVRLVGRAADPDGEIVAHEWRDSDDAVIGSSAELQWEASTTGVSSITYSAQDDQGLWSHRAGVLIVSGEPAMQNLALKLNGGGREDDGRVKIEIDRVGFNHPGPAVDVGAGDFTIEFWLRAKERDNRKLLRECGEGIAWIHGNIILDRDRYGLSRKYGISLLGGRPAFGVSGDGDLTLCARRSILDGDWHHLAFTRRRDNGEMSVFVDGRLQARQRGPTGDLSYPDNGIPAAHCDGPCVYSDPFLVIGAEKHDAGPEYFGFAGSMDELRFSDVVRYEESFEVPVAPFVADMDTVALYHFDEGAGLVIADSAGRTPPSNGILKRGGRPRGPTFEPSTVPLMNSP